MINETVVFEPRLSFEKIRESNIQKDFSDLKSKKDFRKYPYEST